MSAGELRSAGDPRSFERRSGFDRDYWLCRCEGFRVDSPKGRVGKVKWVRFHSSQERPDQIAVVTGRPFSREVVFVAVDEVDKVVPKQRRLVLRAPL
jgi:hypothetical protein